PRALRPAAYAFQALFGFHGVSWNQYTIFLLLMRASIDISQKAAQAQKSKTQEELAQNQLQLEESIAGSSLADYLKKEIAEFASDLVDWKAYQLKRQNILRQEEQRLREKDQPAKVEIEPEAPAQPQAKEKAISTAVETIPLSAVVVHTLPLFFICAFILFLIFFFLTEKNKRKLSALYLSTPNEFIIVLYANMRQLLSIFSLKYQANFLPVTYAELIEKKYNLPENVFLKFTACFEEAKYSRHSLQADKAQEALDYYNRLLNELFRRENKFWLFLGYWLTLFYKRPLFIKLGE
ncbi:MAG: hypothetical protein WC628_03940, partial [Candidatus Omnitrophota bacterium]